MLYDLLQRLIQLIILGLLFKGDFSIVIGQDLHFFPFGVLVLMGPFVKICGIDKYLILFALNFFVLMSESIVALGV